ncbi:hypothetical protein KFK09_022803 [Dendrobium nobile]|uniref:Uncharacterized protein n=1 Tax=Dendrobium nobile TaxID=94219 RepID=A0A8T3AIT9_DENNO|nr:hypothetical protein KFK09_022803 [Dendrobium nobile]
MTDQPPRTYRRRETMGGRHCVPPLSSSDCWEYLEFVEKHSIQTYPFSSSFIFYIFNAFILFAILCSVFLSGGCRIWASS